jgi:hypothetical protein
MDLLY